VLDIGTGSGILAIAAIRLGATEVLGVDIEPESVAAFDDNVRRNAIDAFDTRIECRLGSAGDVAGEWPLVLANIQLEAFRRISKEISARVAPGARLLISGLLAEQAAEGASLFTGFDLDERRDDGEWAALSLKKRSFSLKKHP
jgi:ribosomal protein L11 methyltransferase